MSGRAACRGQERALRRSGTVGKQTEWMKIRNYKMGNTKHFAVFEDKRVHSLVKTKQRERESRQISIIRFLLTLQFIYFPKFP